MVHPTALLILAATFGAEAAPAATPTRIEVPSALIRLIEQADVPAREAGVLADVKVSEGQMVEEGELLAQIMDFESRLARDRAKIEVEIARKNAENDVNLRFAKKSEEVAKAELQRALDSIENYPKSISNSELDHLRLVVERATLEVEQAHRDFEVAAFTRRIKENEYESAAQQVERRKIIAPFEGVVVQVSRHRGEWVKPGDTVLRILRIDRLRAEGFIGLGQLRHGLNERPAKLIVDLPGRKAAEFSGRVVFVSPEIDPVNSQVRVWAEIENQGLRLRPGMRAKMVIEADAPPK